MIIYTVIRHFHCLNLPLKSFDDANEAEQFAELQMKVLSKEYTYSIACWELEKAHLMPCHDKRLRLVK